MYTFLSLSVFNIATTEGEQLLTGAKFGGLPVSAGVLYPSLWLVENIIAGGL